MAGHDSFMSPAYINTIQTSCPWILRYLSAAAVLSPKTSSSQSAPGAPPVSSRVRSALREMVKVIQTVERRCTVLRNTMRESTPGVLRRHGDGEIDGGKTLLDPVDVEHADGGESIANAEPARSTRLTLLDGLRGESLAIIVGGLSVVRLQRSDQRAKSISP
ncbi:hypothetical protein M378DRAFT_16560 [Amanita muscaria Koide BX008]|uniref:Uncharacterized protein n=1 Tax=Amanita muscaria (strain Koide BX008) TaxID=946122 RepID=A0A0C2S327_AMAMK|nr:hypothetical protein M378DRAFT_16560 [Amanita muscaria Koide BX008]